MQFAELGPPTTVQSVIESPSTTMRAGGAGHRTPGTGGAPSGGGGGTVASSPGPGLASKCAPMLESGSRANGSLLLEQPSAAAAATANELTSRNRDMITSPR